MDYRENARPHRNAVRDFQRHGGVLFNKQNADAAVCDALKQRYQTAHDDRGQTERHFIRQHVFGVGHQRLRQRQHLLLSSRQVARWQGQLFTQFRKDVQGLGIGIAGGLSGQKRSSRVKVVFDRQRFQNAVPLGHGGNTVAANVLWAQPYQ